MIRRPTRSTRTYTLFPSTTPVRSPHNSSEDETHLRQPGLLGTPACEEQLARSVDLSDPPQLERCKRELGGNDRGVEAQFLQVLQEHDRDRKSTRLNSSH